MTWAKFDDRYDDHPKIKRAWRRHPRAVGLHAMAVTYSARHETDGMIDVDWLEEKVPAARERETVVRVLVDCGLFDAVDGERFQVHDFTDFNPSRLQLESKRKRDADRKRNPDGASGSLRADSARNPDGIQAEGEGGSNGIPNGASRALPRATPAARPGPSRPDPELHRG